MGFGQWEPTRRRRTMGMSPRRVSDALVRDSPTLNADDPVETAVRRLLESDLPALPIAGSDG